VFDASVSASDVYFMGPCGDGSFTIRYGDNEIDVMGADSSMQIGFSDGILISFDDLPWYSPIDNVALNGGSGDNTLYGDENNDTLHGGNGNDFLEGGGGNDILEGGNGNDTIVSGLGDDVLVGGNGNDFLDSGSWNDVLSGGNGNDVLYGGSASDVLRGDNGNDLLNGGMGSDVMYGGNGLDTFVFDLVGNDGSLDVIKDFSKNQGDKIDISDLLSSYDPLDDALADFVQLETVGADTILSINQGGAGSLGGWVQIAVIENVVCPTDEQSLIASGHLIVG
jgi:Ca2+-binding RTX toxin-like protein